MNLPSGESLVRQLSTVSGTFESRFGERCTEVWIPDVFGYAGVAPADLRRRRVHPVRHPEAELEQAEPVPPQHVPVGGLDGTRGAHPLPAGRHVQRRGVVRRDALRRGATSASTAGATGALMPYGHGNGGGGPTREMLERAARGWPTSTGCRGCASARSPSSSTQSRPRWRLARPCRCGDGELYFEMHRGTLTSQVAAPRSATGAASGCCARPSCGGRPVGDVPAAVVDELDAAVEGACCSSSSTTSSPVRRSPGCTPTPRRRTPGWARSLEASIADAVGAHRAVGFARGQRRPPRPP